MSDFNVPKQTEVHNILGAELPQNIAPPTQPQIRAIQKVIINAFKLQALDSLPSQIKSGIGIVEDAQRLGSAITSNPAMAAGVALSNLNVHKLQSNPFNGKVNPTEPDKAPIDGLSPLGTSRWTNLQISGDSYVDPVTGQTIDIPSYTIYSCLITLSGQKNIVKTNIQGRDGSIKEYIAKNDWDINIKGGIFGLNGQRPVQEIQTLKKSLWVPNISLSVKAPIFDEWDITNMVTENISIPEQMGGYSFQLFELNAISDINLILDLSGL